MDIGARIRHLRRQQNRTLKEIAERCGFTRSLLSKIETGKTSPPVSTLDKIADALGVPLSRLLAEGEERAAVFLPGDRARGGLTPTDKGYAFFPFAAEWGEKRMQPFLFVAEKGRVRPDPLSHRGEEFVYVLEGAMRYRVGAVEYRLEAGDSLFFDPVQEHDLDPLTDRVVFLGIFLTKE